MISASSFRRLAFVTALFAYLQIALGGVVRVSGSGLGCPDWPLCHGRPYPAADIHSIIEYSHRTVGSITGLLVIATVICAWIVFARRRPAVAIVATATLAGIGVEGGLGGLVVMQELQPWLVLVHLGLAMIILGCLLATAILSLPETEGVRERRLRNLSVAGAAATYVMLLTGSTVVASSADAACRYWPLCGGGFMLDFSGVNVFTMLHRGAVLVIGAFVVYVAVNALGNPATRRVAMLTLGVLALQVAVGAVAALTDVGLFTGLHVALATLVWSGMLSLALLTVARSDRVRVTASLAVGKKPA